MALKSLFNRVLHAFGMGAAQGLGQATDGENLFVRFARDRYDPGDLMKQFAQQKPRPVCGAWEWELETELGEIGITLPDANGAPAHDEQAFFVEVLGQVRALDNLVQQSCEQECVRTGLGPENYELAIGWVCIENKSLIEQTLALTYYGLRVNTSWDAKFKQDAAGIWQPVNFLKQAAGTDSR
jgi:hypothetical protein